MYRFFVENLTITLSGHLMVKLQCRRTTELVTLERWDKEEKIQLNKEECDLDIVGRQIDILYYMPVGAV